MTVEQRAAERLCGGISCLCMYRSWIDLLNVLILFALSEAEVCGRDVPNALA